MRVKTKRFLSREFSGPSLGEIIAIALAAIFAVFLIAQITGLLFDKSDSSGSEKEYYKVLRVVDGDTIAIRYENRETLVRLIGIDTPEVDGPYTTAECFGEESSEYLRGMLTGKEVEIWRDNSQDDRDAYDRILRYVSLNGKDVGETIIRNGYGYEYLFNTPYEKREAYLDAQDYAKRNKNGLWASCQDDNSQNGSEPKTEPEPEPEPVSPVIPVPAEPEHIYGEDGDCNIKGNISVKSGEKIYHVPGQRYYSETIISPEKGERWFCTEQEAIAAGWRKSKQ